MGGEGGVAWHWTERHTVAEVVRHFLQTLAEMDKLAAKESGGLTAENDSRPAAPQIQIGFNWSACFELSSWWSLCARLMSIQLTTLAQTFVFRFTFAISIYYSELLISKFNQISSSDQFTTSWQHQMAVHSNEWKAARVWANFKFKWTFHRLFRGPNILAADNFSGIHRWNCG